jgi:hypothetical protein
VPNGDIAATIPRLKFSNPWGRAAIDQTIKHSVRVIEVARRSEKAIGSATSLGFATRSIAAVCDWRWQFER